MPSILTRFLPLWAAGVLAAALLAAVVLLYRRDRAQVSRTAGRVLVALRLLVAGLLVLLICDPVQVSRESVEERDRLLVLTDGSQSFEIREPFRPAEQIQAEAEALEAAPDAIRSESRRELAARALNGRWLNELKSRFDLSFKTLPASLLGPLADEIARTPAGTFAGAILLSDGHDHGKGDHREALAVLRRLGTPVVCVGVGAAETPVDIALESVDATGVIFTGDQVKASVTIAASNVPSLETEIEVLERDARLGSLQIKIPAGSGRTQWPLSFPAGDPGRKKLTVRIRPAEGEPFEGNNSRDLWINILRAKARVLLVDGVPRWEERCLRAAWSREANIELSSFLAMPPPERRLPSELPRGRDALFAFDVVALGDIEPGLFARDEIALLRDFVSARGGTLVLLSGERAMPYRWGDSLLAEILPVQLLAPPPAASAGASLAQDGARFHLTLPGETSEITRIVPGREANLELWGFLPGPRWICPVVGARPGAEVLVTAGNLPAIAWRAFGAGRVLYTGFDSTWKWRYKFGDELHRRFWGQVIRWAISRQLLAADDRVQLTTSAATYAPGAKLAVEALLRSAPSSNAPPDSAESPIDAVVERLADGKRGRLRLHPIPQSGGRYSGEATLSEIGLGMEAAGTPVEHRVWIDAAWLEGYAERQDRAMAHFVVEPDLDDEAHDIGCNRALLEEIAAATGGKFLPLSQLHEAAQTLRSTGRIVERTLERSPMEWPAVAAAILLGLLAIEWALRKHLELF